MQYAKYIGLPALAVIAMMAFAGIAAATSVTSPTGTVYTGTGLLTAVDENGHVTIDNPLSNIECSSTLEGELEEHGVGQPVRGTITRLRLASCTNGWSVADSQGTIEIDSTGGYNGTLTLSGLTIAATRFGIVCRYTTNSTDVGTVTGGHPATIDLEGTLPFHSGSIFCGSGAASITGAYRVSTPTMLFVDE
jgi:hypothetical protein